MLCIIIFSTFYFGSLCFFSHNLPFLFSSRPWNQYPDWGCLPFFLLLSLNAVYQYDIFLLKKIWDSHRCCTNCLNGQLCTSTVIPPCIMTYMFNTVMLFIVIIPLFTRCLILQQQQCHIIPFNEHKKQMFQKFCFIMCFNKMSKLEIYSITFLLKVQTISFSSTKFSIFTWISISLYHYVVVSQHQENSCWLSEKWRLVFL